MNIRLAIAEDAQAIDLFDKYKGNRPTEINREEVWVAEVNNQVVGYVTFNYSFFRKPFIKYLNVAETHKRQGIAQALVLYIEKKCIGQKLFISTESDNLPMVLYFKKHNYRLVGVIDEIQNAAEIVFCKDL